jgi:hypothetical protein
MKKTKVEPLQESLVMISENRLKITLKPKGMESDYNGSSHIIGIGQTIPGSYMASKVFTIMYGVELGKPYALLYSGRNSAKSDNSAEGRGYGKKQMSVCNRLNRGYTST